MRCTVRQLALLVLCLAVALVGQSAAAAATRSAARDSRSSSSRRHDQGHAVDAKLFEPGACMEYPPTSGDRHLTVFLDAGHGGIDPGGVGEDENGNPVYEADETLPVELDTMALLRGKGFTVVVSRTKAETVSRPAPDDVDGGLFTTQGVHDDVAARDVCADKAKANVLLGIYMDAGGSPDNAGVRHRVRQRAPVRRRQSAPGHRRPERRAGGHECAGLGHPEPRGDRRQRAGRARR